MFKDRVDAGKKLAEKLKELEPFENSIILALPRGGVPVAYEVAKRLNIPLDVIIVRKLGAPLNKEFAIGSLVEGNPERVILNEDVIRKLGIEKKYLDEVINKERNELHRREELYRKSQNILSTIKNKKVILIDDGVATGYTIKAALTAIREQEPSSIIVALPVAPLDALRELDRLADQVIILETPEPFWAVGAHYEYFNQTSDTEVVKLLNQF
ncbi:phosphoribosyltransferase [Hydrogenimonas thermophila]|uniref:phosphoribosyltransferase n=1 Tax=Hydrogenimonas thermophila TaxID=223786 RepID=UPI002937139C|nr:phosphoribosyltransferase [Hydrogenimonas thermophila]WOE68897.1 phosphoribosyltransferase [Hydrogenimonas thermophila]WOE71405.1 phosphoribosyltransferase [Hydrogenimonas thermophila]